MAIRRFSTAKPGTKSNRLWDQDTAQGSIEPITQVIASGSGSISITNIPQTYQDLILVLNGSMTGTAGSLVYEINGGGGGIYSATWMNTTSTTGTSRYTAGGLHCIAGWSTSITANSPMLGISEFINYRNTSSFKTVISMGGSTGNTNHIETAVNLWRSTAAITSLLIYNNGGGFISAGSTVTIYGVKAGA